MSKKLLESVERHSISDFLLDEEASIPKGRLLTIGSLMVVLACVLGVQDVFAGHRSHSSHSSHSSGSGGHSSHSSGGYGHGSHSSHVSHSSHSSSSGLHSSHASGGGYGHSSHANGYNYHSNVAPDSGGQSGSAPLPPDMPKVPQILPDTIPPE